MSPATSHKELVLLASRWLKYKQRCSLVLEEFVGGAQEIADAIGWRRAGRESVLVECKTSRSDFLSDQKKLWRNKHFSQDGLGQYRYYMAPAFLLKPDELPENWGLLEVFGRKVVVSKESGDFGRDPGRLLNELSTLWSRIRRIEHCDHKRLLRRRKLADKILQRYPSVIAACFDKEATEYVRLVETTGNVKEEIK